MDEGDYQKGLIFNRFILIVPFSEKVGRCQIVYQFYIHCGALIFSAWHINPHPNIWCAQTVILPHAGCGKNPKIPKTGIQIFGALHCLPYIARLGHALETSVRGNTSMLSAI